MPPDFGGEVLHFADGFLFGGVSHAAGVQENDIGCGFGRRQGVALGDELSGDRFGIALIHLATIGFDKNARHFVQECRESKPCQPD
jgi:hypothetical protein